VSAGAKRPGFHLPPNIQKPVSGWPQARGCFKNNAAQPLRSITVMTDADRIIAHLNLAPHPEGGWYRQTWVADGEGRPAGTAIYFLLTAGQNSQWHKVDAVEIWHFHAGNPLILSISATDTGPAKDFTVGPAVLSGESPQVIVPILHWQSARTTGEYSLVSCTVSPGFQFAGFTLAASDFDIPRN
jgi:uncharacterized protein